MIINITNQCPMNCSHCDMDSTPSGEHMADEVYEQVLTKVNLWKPMLITISGGEPTDHPRFKEYIQALISVLDSDIVMGPIARERIIIASNGLFTHDENRAQNLLSLGVKFQIVNDPKYYPIKVERYNHPCIEYFDKIPSLIFPAGRALTNKIEPGVTYPKCFNIRSLVSYHGYSMPLAIKYMEANGKFCSPLIRPNGQIILGESCLCKEIGSVFLDDKLIQKGLMDLRCDRCGLYQNLPPMYCDAVGEVYIEKGDVDNG